MSNWGFELKVTVAELIEDAVPNFTISIAGFNPIIFQPSDMRLSGMDDPKFGRGDFSGNKMSVISYGYQNKKEAQEKGLQLQHAILLTGLQLDFGFDPGFPDIRLYVKDSQYPRVTTFQNRPTRGFSSGGYKILSLKKSSIDRLEKYINENITRGELNERLLAAMYVFMSGKFTEQRYGRGISKLIALVSTIETIVPPTKYTGEIPEYVKRLADCIKKEKALSDPARNHLLNGVNRLKVKSIGLSCREYIDEKLPQARKEYYKGYGKEASEYFKEAYYLRSKFLHEGLSPEEKIKTLDQYDNFRDMEVVLEELVPELIFLALKENAT